MDIDRPKLGQGPMSITHNHKLFYMKEWSLASRIQYVTFTNINEMIHKVFNPFIFKGVGQITPPPTSKTKKKSTKKFTKNFFDRSIFHKNFFSTKQNLFTKIKIVQKMFDPTCFLIKI